jgi:hypothetical protein
VGLISAIAIAVARSGGGLPARNLVGPSRTNPGAAIQPSIVLPAAPDPGSIVDTAPALVTSTSSSASPTGTGPAGIPVPAPSNAQSAGSTPNPAAGASAPCQITYSVAQSASQFTITIVIANSSAVKINGWTLHWDFPSTQEITYGWNAMVTNGPRGASAKDVGLNMQIPAHGSTTIGFAGKLRGWVPTPSGFTLNGATCQWKPVKAASKPTP